MSYPQERLAEINAMPKRIEVGPYIAPSEHQEQMAVIDWWAYACKSWGIPEKLLFAVPNAGAGASRGQAGKMKAEGARAGIPDLFLSLPREGKHGCYLELKRQNGVLSADQKAVHEILRAAGYRVEVCYGFDQAKAAIGNYLGTLRYLPVKP